MKIEMASEYPKCKKIPREGWGARLQAGFKQDGAQPRSCYRLPLFRIMLLAQLPLDRLLLAALPA